MGLAFGLTAIFLIIAFVKYELSYDAFFPKSEQIFRVTAKQTDQGITTFNSAKTYPGIGEILVSEIPAVTNYTRILYEECMFHEKESDRKFNRQQTYWVDGSFPEIFNLEFIAEGDVGLLYEPNNAIISKSAAERFFGTDWSGMKSPIGKTVYLNEHIPFVIQGVYENIPDNSHMQADFLVSYQTLVVLVGPGIGNGMPPYWHTNYTYLQSRKGTSAGELLPIVNKVLGNHISAERMEGAALHFGIQPIEKIHLNSQLTDELRENGNKFFVWALGLAAGIILIVAWINFINLTTAKSTERAREIGIRKTLGAFKSQLSLQFMAETLISGLISGGIAVAFISLSYNFFRNVSGIEVGLFSSDLALVWLIFLVVTVVGAVVSSIYPAVVLSSFNPARVLKSQSNSKSGNGIFRKALIVFQFTSAMVLLASTGVLFKQVNYMQSQDLGMDMEDVVVLHSPRSMIGNSERAQYFEEFRQALLKNSFIHEMGSSGNIPGHDFLYHVDGVHEVQSEQGSRVSFDLASADDGFLPSLGIDFLAGRNFMRNETDTNKVILNKKGAEVFGYNNPYDAVGISLLINGESYQVIGVTENTHYEGLQKEIRPLILKYGHDYEFGFFTAKISGQNKAQAVAAIEAKWNDIYPNDPFDQFFLKNFFDNQYQKEETFGKIFGVFTILAICIAIMGLFGLVSFTINNKTREIGIRKVMGAGVTDILLLITKTFVALIGISFIISIPVIQMIIRNWLNSFAYRISVDWWWYLIPFLIIMGVTMITISRQALRAAYMNPAQAINEG
jgi:putative ABC transport system permease protein